MDKNEIYQEKYISNELAPTYDQSGNFEIIDSSQYIVKLENNLNILCNCQIQISSKYIFFKLLQIHDLSYFEKKYELKEIVNILNLPPLLYNSLEKVKKIIEEVFKRNKFKFYQEKEIIVLIIKFPIIFEEIESRIELKKIIINSHNFFYNNIIYLKNKLIQDEDIISQLEKKNKDLEKKIEILEKKLVIKNEKNNESFQDKKEKEKNIIKNCVNLNNNRKINDYQCKSILSLHEITTLILLDNKEDIASVSSNSKLIIFELKFLLIKLIINNITDKTILDIIKLSGNRVVITCWDNIIRIIQLLENNTKYEIIQKLEGHTSFINAIIEIKYYENERFLATSSSDTEIIIWEKENNNYKLSKKLKNQEFQVESLIESKKYKELICGSYPQLIINFYDLENFSLKFKLNNIHINRCIRSLNIINEDILIGAGNTYIYIINIRNHEIIKNIKFNDNIEFNCIYLMKNGNILISQFVSNPVSANLIQYSFDENKKELKEISQKNGMHNNYITTILELDNKQIITGGYDHLIKIWE